MLLKPPARHAIVDAVPVLNDFNVPLYTEKLMLYETLQIKN